MTREEWYAHRNETWHVGMTVEEFGRLHAGCPLCLLRVKTKRAQNARRERDQVRRDLGLVKVRGALGGTYWE